MPPLEYNSKMMFCLVNNLIDEPQFDLLFKYVFPIPKIISSMAIYSALGFVASIGEVQTDVFQDDVFDKPGMVAYKTRDENDDVIFTLSPAADGWARKTQRYPGYGYGYGNRLLHFDNWDRTELYYTKQEIKKSFKASYFFRKFDPSKNSIKDGGFGLDRMNKGNSAFLVSQYFKNWAALKNMPWHKIRMLRRNPFNSQKKLCKKGD